MAHEEFEDAVGTLVEDDRVGGGVRPDGEGFGRNVRVSAKQSPVKEPNESRDQHERQSRIRAELLEILNGRAPRGSFERCGRCFP